MHEHSLYTAWDVCLWIEYKFLFMRNAKVGERAAAAAVLFAKGIIKGTNRCQFIQNDTVYLFQNSICRK